MFKYAAPTLVVVDMQPVYGPSHRVLEQVERELLNACAKGWNIVCLRWQGNGPTYGRIIRFQRIAKNRFFIRTKSTKDGTPEIRAALHAALLRPAGFRVCGVMTHKCVASTVAGLAGAYPDLTVEVVTDACADNVPNAWYTFPKKPNIRLVGPDTSVS